MELEESSLFSVVQDIIESGPTGVSSYWQADIHTDSDDTEALKLITLRTFRDYEKNFSDETMLELLIPLGVYAKVIYPNRNKLEITVKRKPIEEVSDNTLEDEDNNSQRYKAVLVLEGLPSVEATDLGQLDQYSLDLQDLLKINFQLFSKTLEKLRIVTVGSIFRKVNTQDVIRSVLVNESKKISVVGEKAIEGVDIVESVNKQIREHIVLPQGLKLIHVPAYVQERCGGVYNAGIGNYLQDRMWYVYPLFDTTRLKKTKKTLTLIKIPKKRFSSLERTYKKEGDNITVIGTDKTRFEDDGGTNFMNTGNGVRIADANNFMGGISKSSDNKTIMSRAKNNSEFISVQKEDSSNNTQVSQSGITANSFNDYSRLNASYGGIFEFVWENAQPNLLFPGMMTKVLYLSNNEITELNGVLLSVDTLVQLSGIGIISTRHTTTSLLTLFVNKVQ